MGPESSVMLHICEVKFTRGNVCERRDMMPLVTLSDMLCSLNCWLYMKLDRLCLWWLSIADIISGGFDMLVMIHGDAKDLLYDLVTVLVKWDAIL